MISGISGAPVQTRLTYRFMIRSFQRRPLRGHPPRIGPGREIGKTRFVVADANEVNESLTLQKSRFVQTLSEGDCFGDQLTQRRLGC